MYKSPEDHLDIDTFCDSMYEVLMEIMEPKIKLREEKIRMEAQRKVQEVRKQEYKNLISFLIISFSLPFAAIVAQTIISNACICFVLYGIQAAAPTISAIVVLCWNKKAKISLSQMFSKEHLRMAVFLPFMIACTTMFLAKIIFCALFGRSFILGSISVTQFIIILWALWAEEIGWRGYLEPLLKSCGVDKRMVPCMVGVIWCLWHYHFFLQNGIEVPIFLFFISCIIESYIYSFLMNVTCDNIVSAMAYHFAWNLLIHIAALNPSDNNGSIFPYLILVILEILALPVLGAYGGGILTKLMCVFPKKLKQPCQKILRRKD